MIFTRVSKYADRVSSNGVQRFFRLVQVCLCKRFICYCYSSDALNSDCKHQTVDRVSHPRDHQNYLLLEFARNNRNEETLNIFIGILRSGLRIDRTSLSCTLKACTELLDQTAGKQVQGLSLKSGLFDEVSVGTTLIRMYMKTRSLEDADKVFAFMPQKNAFSWTNMLAGYSQNGLENRVVDLFPRMEMEGIKPDPFTYATLLRGLAMKGMRVVNTGKKVHGIVIKVGFGSNTSVSNSLICTYSAWDMINDARDVFVSLADRDVLSWNCMITGFVSNGFHSEGAEIFNKMRLMGIIPTEMTFASLLKSSANMEELGFCRKLHCLILKHGYQGGSNLETALMAGYCKCSVMQDALFMFSEMKKAQTQSVVCWSAMISGYLQNDEKEKAAYLFSEMVREGIQPNDFTYSAILTAVPVISPFQLHAQVIKARYQTVPSVGTALLVAYVQSGFVDEAQKVFELISEKDIMAWSAMVAGFSQEGDIQKALKMFRLLREEVKPNEYTYSSIINACTSPTASVSQGKLLHGNAIKSGFIDAVCVSSALVTMYSKRGSIEDADGVFSRQRRRDLVSWNSMITGYAQHGHARKALQLFEEMQNRNIEIDAITFVGVISACTHCGFVNEGENYFDLMKDFSIDPSIEHYACMVDLYARAGMLQKAIDLIASMPFPAGSTIWRTLLSASRVHLNLDIGKLAAEKLIALEPHDSSAYVLLANMYAAAKKWPERGAIRKMMEERNVKKETAYSWIDIKGETHFFLARDHSHLSSGNIYLKLEELIMRLKQLGYRPDTSYVLYDVDEEHKEALLSQHSEKLAMAFGLIATAAGTPLQIVKNLRVCGDCHTVMKLVSAMEKRKITVRDSNRFHHFRDGECSCGDYW